MCGVEIFSSTEEFQHKLTGEAISIFLSKFADIKGRSIYTIPSFRGRKQVALVALYLSQSLYRYRSL